MPKFSFTAIDSKTREPRNGTIDAPDRETAQRFLINKGAEVIGIAEVKEQRTVEDWLAMKRAVPLQSMVYFTRQMATLLNSGMPLLLSVQTLAENEENARLQRALLGVALQIEDGQPMQTAMRKYPDVFDTRYIAMVEAGDKSSHLDDAMLELATDLEKRASLEKSVKSASLYPKIVLGIAFLILSGLLVFIVPKFAQIFEDAVAGQPPDPDTGEKPDASLPKLTQIVVKMSEVLYPAGARDLAWMGQVALRFVGAAIVILVLRKIAKKILERPGPRYRFDNFKLHAPMKFGDLVTKLAIARFARSFASLLKSGMTQSEALPIVAETSGNAVISTALLEAEIAVSQGKSLSGTLERSGAFPLTVTKMIGVGEDTGDLDKMLEKIAEFYEAEVEVKIKGLTQLIEPLMIVVLGGMVGTVVIAMYMPMITIYEKVGAG